MHFKKHSRYNHVHLHFVVYNERIFERAEFSQQARDLNNKTSPVTIVTSVPESGNETLHRLRWELLPFSSRSSHVVWTLDREIRCFSNDSSERLWLATAFINSTESCVIGYNAEHYISFSAFLQSYIYDIIDISHKRYLYCRYTISSISTTLWCQFMTCTENYTEVQELFNKT